MTVRARVRSPVGDSAHVEVELTGVEVDDEGTVTFCGTRDDMLTLGEVIVASAKLLPAEDANNADD